MPKNRKQLKEYLKKKIFTDFNCRYDLNYFTSEKLRQLNLSSEENIKIILLDKAGILDDLFEILPPIDPKSRSEYEKIANGEKIYSGNINQIVEYLYNGGYIGDEFVTNITKQMKRIK